ncbi:hypothetical protein Pd630_LPD16185 (plasmid) [Rhodococcus opacus PD630]|nr:hypothetical protein Pd630_LPD16185 [Rhodococcus opacus PD630]
MGRKLVILTPSLRRSTSPSGPGFDAHSPEHAPHPRVSNAA